MTSLYAAYARDVLSFLDFAQLQECRLVSRSLNANIINHPVSIPARRRLEDITLSVGRSEDFPWLRLDEQGYVIKSKPHHRMWNEVQAEWGCCRAELEAWIGSRS